MKKVLLVLTILSSLIGCSKEKKVDVKADDGIRIEKIKSNNSKVENKKENFYLVEDSSNVSYEKSTKSEWDTSGWAQSENSLGVSLKFSGRKNYAFKSNSKQLWKRDVDINSYSGNHNTEEYQKIDENEFQNSLDNPLSTFSIDVDTAAYANVRKMINNGLTPYKDMARIEEMLNYFDYDYKAPKGENPFSINIEKMPSPWDKKKKLVMIGLQGKKIKMENLPSNNLVFLLDVSGSMRMKDKLPLLKNSLKLLVKELRENDRVSIVVYAGAAGVVLESTPGSNKKKILDAIDDLRAGGSTAGGEGIKLAYKIAKENFIKKGNNRVILATDGDFNVGTSSTSELTRLVEKERESGVFLSVLGFGNGNYKDYRMEELSNKGNGNYAYIDSLMEAKKVLVKEFGGTFLTIAKDVKIQVEFNPSKIKSYRLIGYENRKLANKDFNDDKKDAGELGAGHRVTAIYEVEPYDGKSNNIKLKYQNKKITKSSFDSNEIMTVKLRYKNPKENKSKLIEKVVIGMDDKISNNIRFASAVTEFGMILRDSKYKGNSNLKSILNRAKKSKGKDLEGYRSEFIRMVEKYEINKTVNNN